jgi:small subunit ribosomal protein S8
MNLRKELPDMQIGFAEGAVDIDQLSDHTTYCCVDNALRRRLKSLDFPSTIKKMSLNDPIANVLSHIYNCDKIGKETCTVKPASKIIRSVLEVMKNKGYIEDFKVLDEERGGVIEVSLKGEVNRCGVVKPRFSITRENYETFEKRYLPAKDFGILIITTSQGIMLHTEALEKGIGGKLIAYVY